MVVSCDLGSGPDGFTPVLLQSSCGLFSVPQVSSSERWVYSAEDICGLMSLERLKAEAGSGPGASAFVVASAGQGRVPLPDSCRHRPDYILSIYC